MRKIYLLVTAGPTQEPIDPVRIITNRSTGLLGYELAKEAQRKGHRVTLISGPTYLKPPKKIKFISVESAEEMKKEVLKEFKKIDILIMAAAVSDFRARHIYKDKIKKRRNLTLSLLENPDILKSIPRAKDKVIVGFALETKDLLKNARKKLIEKNLDLIIANKINKNYTPFGEGKKDFIFLRRKGEPLYFKDKTKNQISKIILDSVEEIYCGKQ